MKLAKNAEERASRGEVIITQKEAKGEYGSDFAWNRNTANYGNQEVEPHVFDNINGNSVPARMINYGTKNSYCTASSEIMTTDGDLLMGGSQMFSQKSCKPNTGNAGNYYSWVTAVAGDNVLSGEASDSVCPRGWQLPSAITSIKSFLSLVNSYTTNLSDNAIMRTAPTSFIYTGYLGINSGDRSGQEQTGRYWSKATASTNPTTNATWFDLGISWGISASGSDGSKAGGISVRCVAR